MPPQSRGGPLPTGRQSVSTPNLPTLHTASRLEHLRHVSPIEAAPAVPAPQTLRPPSPTWTDSPSEPVSTASLDDFPPAGEATAPPPSHDRADDSGSSASDSEDEDDDDDDDEQTPMARLGLRPSLLSAHSKSTTYLSSAAFAPPFYNRPPTPLPPSPSLTSLLRPAFSAGASRPGTPDHSSGEDGGHGSTRATSVVAALINRAGTTAGSTPTTTTAAAASTLTTSFRSARPIARASPKVPTYEYYGFTLYLTSSLAFVMYLLWSFLPSPFLHQLGIYYYPNRWWSLAIPAWLVMLVLWIYVALAGYNTAHLTLGMARIEAFVDAAAQVAVVDARGRMKSRARRNTLRSMIGERRERRRTSGGGLGTEAAPLLDPVAAPKVDEVVWKTVWSEGTDAVMDIPIGGVCEVLYGVDRDRDDELD